MATSVTDELGYLFMKKKMGTTEYLRQEELLKKLGWIFALAVEDTEFRLWGLNVMSPQEVWEQTTGIEYNWEWEGTGMWGGLSWGNETETLRQ